MTRHETITAKSIADKDFVLATDLDGTFLGGTDAERKQFYDWIEASRDRVGLIFVTGRDPGYIRELTRKQRVPKPDFVVGDVGTTIASVDEDHFLTPIGPLEAEIAAAWGESRACGCTAAAENRGVEAGLKLQSSWLSATTRVQFFDMDPELFEAPVRSYYFVGDLGLDVAACRPPQFFDVLPYIWTCFEGPVADCGCCWRQSRQSTPQGCWWRGTRLNDLLSIG